MVNGRIFHVEEKPKEDTKEVLKTYFNKFVEILKEEHEG
jgi:hypothetical protein